MKAIRKEDGKEIEVRIYTEKQYVSTEAEEGEIGKRIYREDALIIKEAVDWEAFRREAAKDILAGLTTRMELYIGKKDKCKVAVLDAITLADELVKQLKDGE